jgi:Zn-dependent protease
MDGDADEILMWPLGGLAFVRSLPNTPLPHFIVAVGGPLVNLVLCLVMGLVLYLGFEHLPPLNPFWDPFRHSGESIAVKTWTWNAEPVLEKNLHVILLLRFFYINWILLLFNTVLIGFPFDGGRVLQAGLWPRFGYYQATKIAIYSGFVVMVLIGLFSIIYREPMMAFLAVFIFLACAVEYEMLESAHEDSLFGYDFSQGYTSLEKDDAPPPPKPKKQNFIQRWLAQRAAKRALQEQEEREAEDRRMDELLEKIQKHGKQSLTDEEQRFLKRVSDRYKNKSD